MDSASGSGSGLFKAKRRDTTLASVVAKNGGFAMASRASRFAHADAERKNRRDHLLAQRRGLAPMDKPPPPVLRKDVDKLTDARLRTMLKGTIKPAQWRVETSKAPFQRWAAGADETVATRIAVRHVNAIKNHVNRIELAQALNELRMDNAQHVWVTADKDISGHVPAIKYDPKDLKHSNTAEHWRRDKAREAVVSPFLESDHASRRVVATAATLKLFMSPGEELMGATPKGPRFANYTHIGDLQSKPELQKLASVQQEVRESHKIELAELMHKTGRHDEIPKGYQSFVGLGKSTAQVRSEMVSAMAQHKIAPNTALTSQADMTPAVPGKRLKRAMSEVRLPIHPY